MKEAREFGVIQHDGSTLPDRIRITLNSWSNEQNLKIFYNIIEKINVANGRYYYHLTISIKEFNPDTKQYETIYEYIHPYEIEQVGEWFKSSSDFEFMLKHYWGLAGGKLQMFLYEHIRRKLRQLMKYNTDKQLLCEFCEFGSSRTPPLRKLRIFKIGDEYLIEKEWIGDGSVHIYDHLDIDAVANFDWGYDGPYYNLKGSYTHCKEFLYPLIFNKYYKILHESKTEKGDGYCIIGDKCGFYDKTELKVAEMRSSTKGNFALIVDTYEKYPIHRMEIFKLQDKEIRFYFVNLSDKKPIKSININWFIYNNI